MAGFNNKFDFATDTVNSDITLHAKWSRLEDIHANVTSSVNSVNGNYFTAAIDPNANDVTVTFTNSGLSTTMLGMVSQLSSLLNGFANNENYSSVVLKYGTKSVDIKSASFN
jgi:Listeria-Bacteroides repeat domain (List_Bact_rpt).